MLYTVGIMVGALVPTFLVSRGLLWLTLFWQHGGIKRLDVVHVFSWFIVSFIGREMGIDDDTPFLYLLPQMVWFAVDIFRHWRSA